MDDPIAEIADGKLRGTFLETYQGEKFYAFLGIPFGKPPVGELRFKAPQKAEPWTGIRDATENGNMCYHKQLRDGTFFGSEDCLFLNVYTKNISEIPNPKPVLVFIHGGAFTMGCNSSKNYGPAFLMSEDIVFVTINYRLGILGFMKLNDPSFGITGNAALKDQSLALKWIQDNIKHFGGDPNNVTIFGESAGSASVSYHVLSPRSKGLFHKAIMQSGCALNPWPHLRPNCLDVMKFIKDDCKNEREIYETLMEAAVEDLVEAQHKFSAELIDDRQRTFAPCIEVPNETAFLTRNPIDIITSGEYNKVPMIIGYNSNEGLLMSMKNFQPGNHNYAHIEYEHFVPQQMNLKPDSDLKKEICEKLKKVYLTDKISDKFRIFSDSFFASGIIGFAQNLVRTCPEPIYFHRLSLCCGRNGLRKLYNIKEEGVCHADDLGYFFCSDEYPVIPSLPLVPGSIEELAVKRYMRLWSNFLKYGNPTPDPKEFGITWKPATNEALYFLDVDKELSLQVNPDEEKMRFWRDIFKLHENTKNFMP